MSGEGLDGEAEGSRTPVKIMDNVKMVSLGKNTEFGAALTEDGSLYTWGKWSGNGSIMPKYPAEKIMDHVKTVCMGYDTAAAVTAANCIYGEKVGMAPLEMGTRSIPIPLHRLRSWIRSKKSALGMIMGRP